MGLALEQSSCQPRLPDDAGERSGLEFGMSGNGHGRRCVSRALLHDDMAAALSNLGESLGFQKLAHVAARQDAQLTQPRPRRG